MNTNLRDSLWALEPSALNSMIQRLQSHWHGRDDSASRRSAFYRDLFARMPSENQIRRAENQVRRTEGDNPPPDAKPAAQPSPDPTPLPTAGPAEEARRRGRPIQVQNGVAMIRIRGVMDKLPSLLLELLGGTSTAMARRAVEAAVADPAVKSIMLAMDTPGGSVDGLAELGDAVYAARGKKPIVVQTDGMMASAGYYVGSQADQVYAQRMDLVGSLGTRLVLLDMSRMAEDMGIEVVTIDTAPEDRPFKSAGTPGTKITDRQRDDFQRVVDAFGDDFREMIQRGRGMTPAQVDAVFDGRVWPAKDAQQLGLIDGVQTFEQTMADLRAESGTPRRDMAARGIRLANARRAG